MKSGWTFKIQVNESCDMMTVHYLSGGKAGQTFDRKLTIYSAGDQCAWKQGKERCGKIKDMGDGVFHKYRKNGFHSHIFKTS